MKIKKIKLYKQRLVDKEDGYELERFEEEEVPCVITNRALKMCEQLGVTKSSLMRDIMFMSSNAVENEDGEMALTTTVEDERMLAAIYVGYIGGHLLLGNKEPYYSYDEFLDRYNIDLLESFNIYQDLALATQNEFAQEIVRSTKMDPGTGEKK